MEAPPGAWQRAALVAVPLALVVLVVVTPSLIGREQPATDIPFLLLTVTGRPWNETANETVLVYVRSALGVPLYDYIAINVSAARPFGGTNWSANETLVPDIWVKFPANDTQVVNVSATAIAERTTFRFNATVAFLWAEDGWVLRVQPEGTAAPRDFREAFTASMRREAVP